MWPFGKSIRSSVQELRLSDDVVARYNAKLEFWSFRYDGVEFSVSSPQLQENVLLEAKESLRVVRSLDHELRKKAEEELAEWPCDKSKAHVAVIGLTDFAAAAVIEVALTGDETWGDLALDVVIKEGKIIDVCVGD